jgi:hypothetical protein
VYAGPKAEKAPKKAEGESGKEAGSAVVEAGSGEAVVEADAGEEGSGAAVAVTDPNLEVVDANSEDFAMTGEVVGAEEAASEVSEDDSDFEVNADASSGDEFLEAEEDEPKKRKKK